MRRLAKRAAAAAAALAVGLLAPLAAAPATEAATLDTVVTAFEIDGNMSVQETVDWDSVDSVDYREGCATGDEDAPDTTASAVSQTIHDDPWMVGPGNVNKKDDLCTAGAYSETVDGDVIFYFYWTRAPLGTGDLSVFYELEGGPAGREGDVLLEFNVDPSGSTYVVAWLWDPATERFVQSDAALDYEAALGPNPDYDYSIDDTFGEAAVNLTTSGLLPAEECGSFTTGDLVTRTGNSLPANSILQDFIVSDGGLVLTNCGRLTLDKVVQNDHGGTATGADFTLSATLAGAAEPSLVGSDTNSGVGSTLTAAVLPGSYSLAETTELTAYVGGTWSCTAGTTAIPVVDGTFVMPPGSGVHVVCTIVNDDRPAMLTLVKHVVNDDGGTATDAAFTLRAQSGALIISGVEGASTVTDAMVPAGSWTISEDPVAGYAMTGVLCWTDSTRATAIAVGAGGTIALANGASAYCEITNDDVPAMLTLVKRVINDDGGELVDTAFTLTATGPVDLSGIEGSTGVTDREVPPGVYTIGEIVVSGYELTGVQCWTDSTRAVEVMLASGNRLTLGLGSTAYCEVTNDDIEVGAAAGTLTAVKSVWESSGGSWVLSDGTVSFGDTVQYQILVTARDGDSTGVVVVDALQDGLTSSAPATCSATCTATYDAATATHRIEIATIVEDASVTITFSASVPAAPAHAAGTTVTGMFDNFAAVESDAMPPTDTNIVTVSASHTLADKPMAPRPELPRTGGEPPLGAIAAALALMAAGGLLMARRKREAAEG